MAKPLSELLARKFFEVYEGSLPAEQFARHGYFSAEKFLVLAPSRSQGLANYSPEYSPCDEKKKSAFQDIAQGDGPSIATRQQANMHVLKSETSFAVIPIPLHFKKEYERGFNQAELLAREFCKITSIPLLTSVLKKTKETQEQVKVENKELRLTNLENAFSVSLSNPVAKWPTIILIDDVSTTGATLTHAGNALKEAGAKNIIGLVVAHGG